MLATRFKFQVAMSIDPQFTLIWACRSRRDIENDYYRDWERTTLVAEEETNRPMTVFTFLAFLPSWMKFYALPGPLRFLCYLIWRQISAVGHSIHKQLVLQGAKLDTVLARRSGLGAAAIPRSIILARYHHRVSAIENIKFRLALLSGRRYTPKLAAVDC